MPKALTPKQNRLVDAILDPEIESQAAAARRAGYADNGGHSVVVSASRALTSDNVQRAIASRRAELAAAAGISAVDVLKRIDARAKNEEVPHPTRQRADESLLDVLDLRQREAVNLNVDASTRIEALQVLAAMSPEDVRALAERARGVIAGPETPQIEAGGEK